MKELWRGLHKVTEECGETLQLLGKLGVFPEGEHPDGKGPLKQRLEDELADLAAATGYLIETNGLDVERMKKRADEKVQRFRQWGLPGIYLPD